MIGVKIGQPDTLGYLDVSFTSNIRLRSSAQKWSDSNVGSEIIKVDFITSESTAAILDEDEIDPISISWKVVSTGQG